MMKMPVEIVPCIASDEASTYADKVLNLHRQWDNHDTYFHTLGAVTYLEAFNAEGPLRPDELDGYYSHKRLMNPILKKTFGGLFESVELALSRAIGPAEIIDDLGYPGFHIFGPTPEKGTIDQEFIDNFQGDSWGNLHIDIQYVPHMPIFQKFKKIDLDKTLSFTLALRLPKNGSGLRIWREIEGRENINEFNYLDINVRKDLIGPPREVIYETGKLTYFIGHLVHQVPMTKNLLKNDLRITLQGHGVLCDGIWRLYF
jgi:hypothetical protein